MIAIDFTPADIDALHHERFHHPHPRVQEKMEAVYDYVTSPQFAQKLKAVLEAFQRMRDELESEKNQTMQRWARREKQLEVGKAALLGVGGELQGLAQQDLPQLELHIEP